MALLGQAEIQILLKPHKSLKGKLVIHVQIDGLFIKLTNTYLELFLGFFSLSPDFFLSFFSQGTLTFFTLGTFGIF